MDLIKSSRFNLFIFVLRIPPVINGAGAGS